MFEIEKEPRNRYMSCSDNIALNSTIRVKVGKKIVPMKTTSHRKGDMIHATANNKSYVCEWWFGEWTSKSKK